MCKRRKKERKKGRRSDLCGQVSVRLWVVNLKNKKAYTTTT
jgi:hypothetical protein